MSYMEMTVKARLREVAEVSWNLLAHSWVKQAGDHLTSIRWTPNTVDSDTK